LCFLFELPFEDTLQTQYPYLIILREMIVVTGSEREETQEGKIKGAISIPTHP
jgi:hypothetical protein